MSLSAHFYATVVACFSFLFLTAPLAIAENATPPGAVKIERVHVGFDGHYKLGKWTRVAVDVVTSGRFGQPMRLEIDAVDPYGSLTTIKGPSVDPSSADATRLEAYFQSGRLDSSLEVRVVVGDVALDPRRFRVSVPDERQRADARQRVVRAIPLSERVEPANDGGRAISHSDTLIVTLGKPSGFSATAADDGDPSTRQDAVFGNVKLAELSSASELPVDARGYESIDVMIIAGEYGLDERRSAALQDWVQGGGRLIVSVGANVKNYQATAIAAWIPVKAVDQFAIPDTRLSGIEQFSRQGEKIVATGRAQASKLAFSEGRVLVHGRSDESLVVRVPYCFGQVTFLAVDLDRPPLSSWKPLPFFCHRLVFQNESGDGDGSNPTASGQLSHSGITELDTQLHGLIEDFPEVYRLSSWMVMGLLLAYLVVIGPLDYLLVHKIMQKPKLTWITFPVMIIVGALAAVWGATWSNGTEILVNQFDIVDIDQQSGRVRTSSWMNPYSPKNRRYDIAVKPLNSDWKTRMERGRAGADVPQAQPLISWSGTAETTYGGMYRTGGVEPGGGGYTYLESARGLSGYPISIWSTRPVASRWTFQGGPLVESSLKSVGMNQLQGSMIHHLPVPIEQWIVAYGNRVFRPTLGDDGLESFQIHPNRVWDPNGAGVHQRELRGFLTRTIKRKVASAVGSGEDILTAQAKYDPLSRDPVDFMRMLTFHDVSGGRNYTGLTNRTLRQLDFSSFLQLDRAVLFGRIRVKSAELQIDGESVKPTNHVAFVRFLLPVKRTEVVRPTLPKLTSD